MQRGVKFVFKMMGLLCGCGGPLFFLNRRAVATGIDIKDQSKAVFVLHFLPVALALFGGMSLWEDEQINTIDRYVIYVGGLSMLALVGESLYAIIAVCWMGSPATQATEYHTDDTGLVLFGCFITFVTFYIYAILVRRRLFLPEQSTRLPVEYTQVAVVGSPFDGSKTTRDGGRATMEMIGDSNRIV